MKKYKNLFELAKSFNGLAAHYKKVYKSDGENLKEIEKELENSVRDFVLEAEKVVKINEN